MSDENTKVEEPVTAKAENPVKLLDFGAVFAKLKDLGSFFSLCGKASAGEYWSTAILLFVPLFVLSLVCTIIALVLDPSATSGMVSYPMAFFTALATTNLVAAVLAMFPVTVRRLNDARFSAWFALAPIAVVAFPCPWFAFASIGAVIAFGFLPAKGDADEAPATVKPWFSMLVVLLAVLAAAMYGSMMTYFMEGFQARQIRKAMEKGISQLQKSLDAPQKSSKKGGDESVPGLKKYESLLREGARIMGSPSESEIQRSLKEFKNASAGEREMILKMTEGLLREIR